MSLLGTPSTSSQQTPTLFGSSTTNVTTNNQKPNLFGSLNTNTNTTSSNPFGSLEISSSSAPATTANTGKSLFDRVEPAPNNQASIGAASQAPSGGSLFDRVTPGQAKPANSVFGTTTQPPQPTTSVFGNMGQQNQGGGLFSNLNQSNPQNQQNQQNQSGSLFSNLGQSNQQNTQSQGGGLFGSLGGTTQQKPQGTSNFGRSSLVGGVFGQNTIQQTQQQSGQPQGDNSLFGGLGGLGQSTQQQPQAPQQAPFGQSILAPQQDVYPRMYSSLSVEFIY